MTSTVAVRMLSAYSCAGKTLVLEAGGERRVLVEDDIRKKHEDEQKAKLASAKGSGRFG